MQLVRLPRLGQTMEKGIITLWVVAEGETFTNGQPLYEVETEKMVSEVEARQDGVLARILVPAGHNEVPVGTSLAVIAVVGEAFDAAAVDAFVADGDGGVAETPTDEGTAMARLDERPPDAPQPLSPFEDPDRRGEPDAPED